MKCKISLKMKKVIFSSWNFMRFIRLGLGIAIIIQSVISKDWAIGALGVLFTCMPIFNIGCCAAGGCTAPPAKNTEPTKEIIYEEVV